MSENHPVVVIIFGSDWSAARSVGAASPIANVNANTRTMRGLLKVTLRMFDGLFEMRLANVGGAGAERQTSRFLRREIR